MCIRDRRADRNGPHRVAFEKNKKILLKTQNTCGICGQPVDKSLRYPHPLSPVIDHIIPVNRNGHPSDIKNLQLAHWQCKDVYKRQMLCQLHGWEQITNDIYNLKRFLEINLIVISIVVCQTMSDHLLQQLMKGWDSDGSSKRY